MVVKDKYLSSMFPPQKISVVPVLLALVGTGIPVLQNRQAHAIA